MQIDFTNYFGKRIGSNIFRLFCRNPGFKTIEEDLLKAFKDAGTISDEWYETPSKGFFQRASRTDKGVSAARMIISLKMSKSDFPSTF